MIFVCFCLFVVFFRLVVNNFNLNPYNLLCCLSGAATAPVINWQPKSSSKIKLSEEGKRGLKIHWMLD
jgi:hypothetical protein